MAAVSFCALSVALFPFALAGRSGHILTAQAQAQAQGPLGETGIRSGLKIRFLQGSAGSSPAGATTIKFSLKTAETLALFFVTKSEATTV